VLIAKEDEPAFAATVVRLLNDRLLQNGLRDSGLTYVQRWTAEAKTRQLIGLYESVL
jgi:hypothetical protein